MVFGEKIRERRESLGMSPGDLAKKVGVTEATISRYETGGIKSPTHNKIKAIATALSVDVNYLFGWSEKLSADAISVDDYARLPIIGTVRAGYGGIAYENLEGYEFADVKNPENHFFLRVKGDSMAPDIRDGDLALIRKQDDIESGQVAVVIINGDEATIKKVIKKCNSVILQPFNPEYPPLVIVGEELNEVHIVGKVVETVRIRRW